MKFKVVDGKKLIRQKCLVVLLLIFYIRQMSWTNRSIILQPHPDGCLQTQRDSSVAITNKRRSKGISLSKELDSNKSGRSSSFIKVVQKGKKPVIVQRREIKLILKVKQERFNSQFSNSQNRQDYGNTQSKLPKYQCSNSLISKGSQLHNAPLIRPVKDTKYYNSQMVGQRLIRPITTKLL